MGEYSSCHSSPGVNVFATITYFGVVTCQDTSNVERLLGLNVVARAIDYVTDGACQNDSLLIMLLANVTTVEKGSQQLLQLGQGVREGFNM